MTHPTVRSSLLPLRKALAGAALLAALTTAVPSARADEILTPEQQQEYAESAAESRSATFQAVTGAVGEDVPGGPLLVAAYGAVLVLVLGYVLYLGSLTAGASRDLERLEKTLGARGEGPTEGVAKNDAPKT